MVKAATPAPGSRQLLHHDPVALNLVQFELDRGDRFSLFPVGCLDPRISPLARNRTTRQPRLMRLASFAGVSFLEVRRRGGMCPK